MRKIVVGAWRDGSAGPMQVVSGPGWARAACTTKRPGAGNARGGNEAFIEWFNAHEKIDPVIKAAGLRICGLSPFTRSRDGNGRIARANQRTCRLARSENQPATLLQYVGTNPHASGKPITTCFDTHTQRAISM